MLAALNVNEVPQLSVKELPYYGHEPRSHGLGSDRWAVPHCTAGALAGVKSTRLGVVWMLR